MFNVFCHLRRHYNPYKCTVCVNDLDAVECSDQIQYDGRDRCKEISCRADTNFVLLYIKSSLGAVGFGDFEKLDSNFEDLLDDG